MVDGIRSAGFGDRALLLVVISITCRLLFAALSSGYRIYHFGEGVGDLYHIGEIFFRAGTRKASGSFPEALFSDGEIFQDVVERFGVGFSREADNELAVRTAAGMFSAAVFGQDFTGLVGLLRGDGIGGNLLGNFFAVKRTVNDPIDGDGFAHAVIILPGPYIILLKA